MALYFLKQNEVYHVDLKPGNVLITRNFVVKLTDFGESFCANNLVMTNREVQEFRPGRTFPFAAPELDD
jgi:serine/threonine protein kinase